MRRHFMKLVYLMIGVVLITGCNIPGGGTVNREWDLIKDSAMGTTVNLYAWGGNAKANAWFDGYLKNELMETYGIKLVRTPLTYQEIFELLAEDKRNENNAGQIDLLWISGVNFKHAYEKEYLFGPFADKLPAYQNTLSPKELEVMYDAYYKTSGYEVPFGRTQFMMFYNEDLLFEPPENFEDFTAFIKSNPGMFTYPAPPDAVGSAFVRSLVYQFVNYKTLMDVKPNKDAVARAIQPAVNYLKEIDPYLWQKGEAYPSNTEQLDALFFDNEIMMSMSYDHNHATDKIAEYEYPDGTKPITLSTMVGRTHYMAIPYNSTNKSGAMVVINHCLGVDAQASKFKIGTWGDIPVLERNLLDTADLRQLKKSVTKKTSPDLDDLLDNRVPEMPTDIANLINEIWMEEVGQ